jgi:hypothetical protein
VTVVKDAKDPQAKLRFPPEALRVVDLDAEGINAALDALKNSIDHIRTVIVPSK